MELEAIQLRISVLQSALDQMEDEQVFKYVK